MIEKRNDHFIHDVSAGDCVIDEIWDFFKQQESPTSRLCSIR